MAKMQVAIYRRHYCRFISQTYGKLILLPILLLLWTPTTSFVANAFFHSPITANTLSANLRIQHSRQRNLILTPTREVNIRHQRRSLASRLYSESSNENNINSNNVNNDNDNNTVNNNWRSHVSTHPDALQAWDKVWSQVPASQWNGEQTVAFLFVGQAHAAQFEELVERACQTLPKETKLVSAIGAGVIGEQVELDQPSQPCLSLLVGSLPKGSQVEILQYKNQADDQGEAENDNEEDDEIDDDADETVLEVTTEPASNNNRPTFPTFEKDSKITSCLILADPWAPVEAFLAHARQHSSDVVHAGGITCPMLADQSSLAINDELLPQGSLALIGFVGTLGLETMVAQGCRPVSPLYQITGKHGFNVVTELDGQPALKVLQQLANAAPASEQALIESGLLCGIASSAATAENSANNIDDKNDSNNNDDKMDFLSRQMMGFVPSLQGIAIGTTTPLQVGDYFCFQVRDGTTAEQDLKLMVQRTQTARLFENTMLYTTGNSNRKRQPLAAIQISCIARGRGMYGGIPHVDVSHIQNLVDTTATTGQRPVVAGFFANGEIGPVGLAGFSSTQDTASYLHSFTTVAAILVEYDSTFNIPESESTSTSASSPLGINAADGGATTFDDAWG